MESTILHRAKSLVIGLKSEDFRQAFPEIELRPPGGHMRTKSVLAAQEIIPVAGSTMHVFLKFEQEALSYYELNCSLPTGDASCAFMREQYLLLLPIVTGQYGAARQDVILMDCREFLKVPLPRDGYPSDRYVIGGMSSWGRGSLNVVASFARVWPESTMFQLRAIQL